ncbi:transcriptional regulator [Cellulophaga sp. BC115SP]|uniref:transcriptional regulator n=1 Tax=Cellulophaga sp. BC115SP TaxID=2683263 RepID=UPI0014128B22|nr:transcriptional regulator [Cellulophaga sp. BC115SP]NBB31226.1 transcriptional regulator [Cellulophaga sp. BC115SP]
MIFQAIQTEEEYELMLAWIDKQFDQLPTPNCPEGEQLQLALSIVKAYEDIHYPIPSIQS